jgi:ribose transport system ATP-binding protein
MAEIAGAPRFEMRGIRKTFGATVALDGVSFSVSAGEVCALVGQNGAGKSTLMSVLSGAIQPDAGTMSLGGAAYAPRNPLDARRAGIAMIYQELSLAPHLSVMENILLGAEPVRRGLLDWSRMRALAAGALAELGHSDIAPDAPVERLSPAAQQLVEIARAVALGANVLVLDEPTSALGQKDVDRLFRLIERLKAQRHAIVYISHFLEEVQAVADRFVVLRDGRIAGDGTIASTTREQIVSLMVGRSVEGLYPHSARQRGEAVLEVEALEPGSATFTLHRGEIFGIAGLMGAGRTRLLRTLFGLEPVRSGRIRIAAHVGPATPAQRWDQGMGFLSEDRKSEGLAAALDIADNMTMSQLRGLGPGPIVSPSKQHAAAAEWIQRLAIRCTGPRQPVSALSGGNQQKVALARLLHHDVDVLVLDEPTRGIDIGSKAQIYALMDALATGGARSRAKAILMVSSYLPELIGVCDRIAVMTRGRLGPPHDAAARTEHQLVAEATGAATS